MLYKNLHKWWIIVVCPEEKVFLQKAIRAKLSYVVSYLLVFNWGSEVEIDSWGWFVGFGLWFADQQLPFSCGPLLSNMIAVDCCCLAA